MHTPDNNALRKIVDSQLGAKAGEASKPHFEKAKSELILAKTTLTKAINLITFERYLEVADQSAQGASTAEKNATEMLDSYFIPLPSESINAAFVRAKKESIGKLKNQVAQLKYFSFKDYSRKRKKKPPIKKVRATNFDNVRVEKKRTS